MDPRLDLPGVDDVGREDEWTIPTEAGLVIVHAVFLGTSSSYRSGHRGRRSAVNPTGENHPGADFATIANRCSSCRWFEPRLYRETGPLQRFLAHRTGVSIVPGEVNRFRLEYLISAQEVIEHFTTRHTGQDSSPPFLSVPAAKILGQAAGFDDDMRDAWDNRAVK
jgi:hypothetical protein